MAAPPVAKFDIGGVEAAVWAREDEVKGTQFTITTQKTYWSKKKEDWVHTNTFFLNEACTLIQVLNMAVAWAAAQPKTEGRTFTGDPEKKETPF